MPSLTGGQEAEAEQVFVLWFDTVFGTCTPALVLRHRFAKNVNIFISFISTLLDSEPYLCRGTENPFLVIIDTVPPPRMTPGPRKLVAKKTLARPLVSWLPLT